jgi:hypothetical protein
MRKPKFTAGLFGWVAPSKLVVEVIEGFSRFAAGLSEEDRKDVGLRIVGQLPDPGYYDPVGAADRLPHRDLVDFQGFVPLERFETEMQACSLVFNLRFPSCGESSGTLARAHRLGVPVVTTAYQAFHEEASDAQVSVDPARIAGEIAALLARYHAEWKASGRTRTRERDLGSLQEHDIRRVFRRVLEELAVEAPVLEDPAYV